MSEESHSVHEAYAPQRDNTKVGFWVFLSGEVILFGILIGSFLLFRHHHAEEFAEVKAGLSIPLIALNTFILILSSFLVVRALEALRGGSLKGLRNNLIGVLVLGALFLGGQAFEWSQLYREASGSTRPLAARSLPPPASTERTSLSACCGLSLSCSASAKTPTAKNAFRA